MVQVEKFMEKFILLVQVFIMKDNNIMKKLGIHKQAELVRYAIKEGIAQL